VALVFQNFSLYPRWTVRKNLEFPLRAPGRNLPPDEIRSRVEWAADLLKITGHLDREAVRLSGGEMQRVAIGRAIVRCPRVFLMDEPLSNLDAKLREALRVELVELRRALRTPMVFVTHDQVEALSMADRIAVLSGGRILQLGTPKEIYESPASLEAAVQLGQPAINRIRVRRVDGWWIARDGTPILKSESVAGGDEMLLGVRPENIEPTGGTHEGRVHIVVDLGATRVLLVHWAGSEFHITTDRTGEFKPGDMIRPRLRHQSAIFWPASAAP
jgi:multiple sugar transport system ATP-binding protein